MLGVHVVGNSNTTDALWRYSQKLLALQSSTKGTAHAASVPGRAIVELDSSRPRFVFESVHRAHGAAIALGDPKVALRVEAEASCGWSFGLARLAASSEQDQRAKEKACDHTTSGTHDVGGVCESVAHGGRFYTEFVIPAKFVLWETVLHADGIAAKGSWRLMEAVRDLIGMVLLGFFGSAHCMGMCGPISIGVGARSVASMVLYNCARIATYTVIGAVLGAVGPVAGAVTGLARAQLGLALISGLLLGWFGLAALKVTARPSWMESLAGILPGVGPLLRRAALGGWWVGFPLGLLLGFLPCGLSMAAFVRALGAGGPGKAAILVLAFGVGTLPAMLLTGWLGGRLQPGWRKGAEIIAGIVLITMGVQQIARVFVAIIGA